MISTFDTDLDAVPSAIPQRRHQVLHNFKAFTLIELMISISLAMLMAVLASTTFLKVRSTVNRTEARMAMHAAAQTIYTHLHQQFLSAQQSCAFVITTTQKTDDGTSTDPGSVRLIFMHAKEDSKDFDWLANTLGESDLLWSEWMWSRGSKTLFCAQNQPLREYASGQFESGGKAGFTPGGHNYDGVRFTSVPQPRRRLDPVNPTTSLDDNIYFPTSGTMPVTEADPRAVSLANVDDIGDFTDLQRRLAPALAGMKSFAIQVVSHDDTLTTYDDSTSVTDVRQGVWTDGRLTRPSDDLPVSFAASTVAKRPKIIRLRFTLTDRESDLEQTFSFSFALPGMLPTP